MKIQLKYSALANRFRRLMGRIQRVEQGSARGLLFDSGPEAALYVLGTVELPIQDAVDALLNRGDIFYDVGANVGFFSVLAGRIVGSTGSVYAFEPVPENASRAEKNARLNRLNNVEVRQIALSNQNGQNELLLARHSGGAVLKGAGIPPDLTGSMAVETFTLDAIVEKEQLPPPNLVKIDVEGAELNVLRGMKEVIQQNGPKIIVEVDDEVQSKCLDKLSACQAFLSDLGYRSKIFPNSYPDGRWFVRHFFAEKEN